MLSLFGSLVLVMESESLPLPDLPREMRCREEPFEPVQLPNRRGEEISHSISSSRVIVDSKVLTLSTRALPDETNVERSIPARKESEVNGQLEDMRPSETVDLLLAAEERKPKKTHKKMEIVRDVAFELASCSSFGLPRRLVTMPQRNSRRHMVSNSLLLLGTKVKRNETGQQRRSSGSVSQTKALTSNFSSGNPPSIFLSHTSSPCFPSS